MNRFLFLFIFLTSNFVFANVPGRSVVYGVNGMAATAHPMASQVAIDLLKKGANAIEAAVAANAALGAIEPAMCGIGGDLFAIVWSAKEKKLIGLNASGPAPERMTLEQFERPRSGEPLPIIPMTSAKSWTVPGTVDGWFKLINRFRNHRPGGRKAPSVRQILQPAIQLARSGFPVPRVIAHDWQFPIWFDLIKEQPGFRETFLIDGQPPVAGQIFRNPELARTYSLLANPNGRYQFYRGKIAKQILEFSNEVGGLLSAKDLSEFESEWVTPVSTTYKSKSTEKTIRIWQLPPNGQGVATLQLMNLMEILVKKYNLERNSANYAHAFIEAKRLVYEDLAKVYADPRYSQAPLERLISKSYAEERAALIDMTRAQDRVEAGVDSMEKGDTTYITVADKDGNMVSLIQSHYFFFGTGHTVAGFPMQNRGALFSLDPNHANVLVPGKRPFHTIIPAFVTSEDGKTPMMSFGVMGGAMQPQGQTQVLLNMFEYGMNIQAAGEAARIKHSGSSNPKGQPARGKGIVHVETERGISDSVVLDLRRRGHDVNQSSMGRNAIPRYMGGYQAISRDPISGVYACGSEPRKDGACVSY